MHLALVVNAAEMEGDGVDADAQFGVGDGFAQDSSRRTGGALSATGSAVAGAVLA